jgi:hypothetical protein
MHRDIVFLSDLGIRDEAVGVCHGVIARIAPDSRVIDLTHGIPPLDVLHGALVLRQSLAYVPDDAVVLAVVDPGVGTGRRAIVVESVKGRLMVGPDNGVLSLAWMADGGAARAVQITSPEVSLQPISPVFHGRDVFTPAAAHLAAGDPIDRFGPEIPAGSLISVETSEPEVAPGRIVAEVIDVDRFGNVRLNVRPADLGAAGIDAGTIWVETLSLKKEARRVATYGEVATGEYGVLEDAWGWISLIRDEGNAANQFAVGRGDRVWLSADG